MRTFAERGENKEIIFKAEKMSELISNIFKYNTHVSFEVFPPKNNWERKRIYRSIAKLKTLSPDFFSVTYGSGGSTARTSLEIASAITNLAQVNCVAHLTCAGMSKDEIGDILKSFEFHGVHNVLALRGDPPAGETKFVAPKNGFSYASQLVRFIRERSSLGILVAGYPEGHKDSASGEEDFNLFLEKVNSGADGIITQLFFDNRHMLNFADKLHRSGIVQPLIAGIFPVSNAKQIMKITELSGASIPPELEKGIQKYAESPEDMEKFGTDFAVKQVRELIEEGIYNFHFYTMNRYGQTRDILLRLKDYFPRLKLY